MTPGGGGGGGGGGLPASHGVVSVQHLLAQLAVLDPPGELNVSELITQQLGPQEALQISRSVVVLLVVLVLVVLVLVVVYCSHSKVKIRLR